MKNDCTKDVQSRFTVEGSAAASASERARQSVNRALKMVEERIAEHDPALGAIFSRSRREPLAPLTLPPTAPADPCESGPHSFVQSVFTLDPVNTPTQENGAPPWSTNRGRRFGHSAVAYNPILFVTLRRNQTRETWRHRTLTRGYPKPTGSRDR